MFVVWYVLFFFVIMFNGKKKYMIRNSVNIKSFNFSWLN